MTHRLTPLCALFLLPLGLMGCRKGEREGADSARGTTLVLPSQPAVNTNWNPDAGPVMITSVDGRSDTVAVVLPEATDSTIATLQGLSPPISGLRFDLFGRGGKVGSAITASPLPPVDPKQECDSWPLAKLQSPRANWRVGFASGHVQAIKVDSIEAMSSTDSAALAASLAQAAATLPVTSDPTFRGLPFRVRSAYTFRLDSVDVVVADVVRSVNEEATPKLEHILIIGERPARTSGKYTVGYYSRTAGPEESTQATEALAAVQLGTSKRPAIVVNVEYDDGGRLGFIERVGPGEWRATWRSAYTDC